MLKKYIETEQSLTFVLFSKYYIDDSLFFLYDFGSNYHTLFYLFPDIFYKRQIFFSGFYVT